MKQLTKSPLQKFSSALQSEVLTLHIYDGIGADMFGEGITAQQVAEELTAKTFSGIVMRISSPGGDPFEAVAIYNLLRSQGKPITAIVDGIAASAASLLAMAGDTIQMGQSAMLMIHNAMKLTFGNATDMRSAADTLDKVSSVMRDIYVKRTGMSGDQVQHMMDAETWMNADEAVKLGFATEHLLGDVPGVRALTALFDLSQYKHAPNVEAWDEAKHPRKDNGQFGTGSGDSGGSSSNGGSVSSGSGVKFHTPEVHSQMGKLYDHAEVTYNFKDKKQEYSFTVNKDGSVTEITTSNKDLHNSVTVNEDTAAIVHTHPVSADPEPSPGDIQLAKDKGLDNYALSKEALWVAHPDGSVEKVGSVTFKKKVLTINYTTEYAQKHPDLVEQQQAKASNENPIVAEKFTALDRLRLEAEVL